MKLQSLRDRFLYELKDLYGAENQIIKALPKMAKAASSPQLQEAFHKHLEQTQSQVERLDQIFDQLGIPGKGRKCEGIEGIISEGEEFLKGAQMDPDVKDAALIASAQKVEHYEMAGYGTVRTYAKLLGEDQIASLLDSILAEEKQTDKELTAMAESKVNIKARH